MTSIIIFENRNVRWYGLPAHTDGTPMLANFYIYLVKLKIV